MPLACPQCKQFYERSGVCPTCNVVLLYHAPGLDSDPNISSADDEDAGQWQQTPWGKILIGLILAQGLSFGLLQLLKGGILATGVDGTDPWETLWGIVLRHAIHAFSLIVGGALTGAGQRRGIIYGSLVGFTSGVITFFLRGHPTESLNSILVYAEPVMHMALGGLGGGLGMLIWRPTPSLPELESSNPSPAPAAAWGYFFVKMFSGPIHIGRVCAGAFVIVIGVVWANAILEFLLRASGGALAISSQLQAQLVSMEISALVGIVGAGFAGATTRNGFKQGLCVGIGASMIVVGIQASGPKFTIESTVSTVSAIIAIALVGGWFGSQLFPPLSGKRRRRGVEAY